VLTLSQNYGNIQLFQGTGASPKEQKKDFQILDFHLEIWYNISVPRERNKKFVQVGLP